MVRVGLFGASSLGRQCLAELRTQAGVTPSCFFDNDPTKWGTGFEGLPVERPTASALTGVDVVWITTCHAAEVLDQLATMGLPTPIAHTLFEVLSGAGIARRPSVARSKRPSASGRSAADSAAPVPERATPQSNAPAVTVVLADEGWILERCARELETRLPYVRVSRQPVPAAAVNYYMNYSAYRPGVAGRQAAFFTHIEERVAAAADRFFEVARAVDVAVAMSERYARALRDAGIPDVRVIPPGVDLERFQPRVRIGVVGRTYHTGRKGEDLVRAVMDEPHIEWHFTGEGWPGPARHYRDDEMPEFYRSMDYILVPAHYEGGPMPLLEALASGTEVVAPRVGFVEQYPHIEFEAGNAADLRRVLRSLIEPRLARRRAVESRTWDAWAAEHDRLFRGLAAPTQAAAGSHARVRPAGDGRLRVLFARHAPESLVPVGGPAVRLPRMKEALKRHDVDAEIAGEELPDPSGYNLVHVFNVWDPSAALRQLQHLKRFGVPVAFSPIYLRLEEGLWAQRTVLPLFRRTREEGELADGLAQLARTPMAMREALGLCDPAWERWPDRVRELTGLADHLIVLSEHETGALHALGALDRPSSLVHNGVDPSWSDGVSAEPFAARFGVRDYVLSVGRIEPRKNQLLLARALRDAAVDLVLVGEVAKPEYADLVRQHGGRVHLVGRLDHDDPLLRSAFAGARVFALPSWSEGAPLVALEAAAFGLPLVLSDRSGEREYFGPLAAYCDPLDLAGIRTHVLDAFERSPSSRAAHRAALRGRLTTALTWNHTGRETAQAYGRILDAGAAAGRTAARAVTFRPPAPRRLEIGSGTNPQPGYEHLDARPDLPDIDHIADIRQALPFPNGTFDEVMSRSCIEHVSWREVRNVLAEWGRVLKPGGRLDVWTPDFEYLCRKYLAGQDDRHLDPALAEEARRALGGYDSAAWAVIKMFGGQDYPENFHGAVLDEGLLTRVLHAAGFARVERHEPFWGLRLIAQRLPAFQGVPAAARESETPEPGYRAGAPPPSVLWDAPVFNYSGYAALSRHAVRALTDAGVPVQVRPRDDDESMRQACLASPAEGRLWTRALRRYVSGGAYVCCYTPADWQGRSIFHQRRAEHRGLSPYVGLTMFETDRLPQGWREACEALDEIWVPSEFNRETFARGGVPPSKIQVVPVGVDAGRHDPAAVAPLDIAGRRGFVFLSVFDWSLRKGWDILLRAFVMAFTVDDDVCLVLRTAKRGGGASASASVAACLDRLERELHRRPAVTVLEDPISEDDMPRLYRAADAFVLPTRGEGWGLPIMEAMAAGLPVIVSRWGAHLDFVSDDTAYLIDVNGTVPVDAGHAQQSPFYGRDHRWAEPSVESTVARMREVFEHREAARRTGARARQLIASTWTPRRTADWIAARLRQLAPDPTGAMDQARAAESAGRLDEAEALYARAAAARPGWMLPVYNRASILKRQRRRASARGLFEDVAARGDTPALRAGSCFHLGQLAFDEGDLDGALSRFDQCLVEMPGHSRAKAWRAFVSGRLAERTGDLAAALAGYASAHEADAQWGLAAYNLASVARRLGEATRAASLFADVARAAEDAALRGGAHFHLAQLRADAGDVDAARGHLESCLIEVPGHGAASRLLGELPRRP